MKVISLQSGSNGNAIYVESGPTRLLVDAGISGKQAMVRLEAFRRDIRKVQGVLVSHDHRDHVCCAGVYQRKFRLPLYVTGPTLAAAKRRVGLGALGEINTFAAGEKFRIGHLTVETISTPHDGADGVAFVIDDGRHRLGVLTDLGHVFTGLDAVIGSLDAVVLESNYDDDMLEAGWYPWSLKQRIRGEGGHLSNVESAELLLSAASPRLQWAALAHLSQDNNEPQLALRTHRHIVGRKLPLAVAGRYEPVELPEL